MDRKKKLKRGRIIYIICLFLWLLIMAGAIYYGLTKFNTWLTDYQAAYDSSRPELLLDEYVKWFQSGDIDSIYNSLDVKPAANNFEGEEEIKAAMLDVLTTETASGDITWEKAPNFSEALPEYYVLAGNYIVAHIHLSKNQETTDYGFPTWSFSYLSDFYCEPEYDIKISVPSTVDVTVNGKLLDDNYLTASGEAPEEQKFFDGYAELPVTEKYAISDFYYLPTVTATHKDGYPVSVVFNDTTGVYEIDYGISPDLNEMEDVATQAAKTFAGYVSNDVPKADMLACFVPDCEIIDRIVYGREQTSEFYMYHTKIEFNDIKIDRMNCYSNSVFACDVHMSQDVYQGRTEPTETNRINYRFYFVKTDDGWKACNFELLAYEE